MAIHLLAATSLAADGDAQTETHGSHVPTVEQPETEKPGENGGDAQIPAADGDAQTEAQGPRVLTNEQPETEQPVVPSRVVNRAFLEACCPTSVTLIRSELVEYLGVPSYASIKQWTHGGIRCRDEDYYRERMQRYVNTHAEPEPEPEDEDEVGGS